MYQHCTVRFRCDTCKCRVWDVPDKDGDAAWCPHCGERTLLPTNEPFRSQLVVAPIYEALEFFSRASAVLGVLLLIGACCLIANEYAAIAAMAALFGFACCGAAPVFTAIRHIAQNSWATGVADQGRPEGVPAVLDEGPEAERGTDPLGRSG